jgi:peptidoglycan/LPS O-acetylase OafA/YrhL
MAKFTFAQLGDGRDNNFDFLRFFMAASVVYGHSFAMSIASSDPLDILTAWQVGFGSLAVQSFFFMSGYLVTRSWQYSKSWQDFAKKRALRIFPALIVVLLFCVFVIGPLAATDTRAYFTNPKTYRYLGLMLAPDIDAYDNLPGVFAENPLPHSVNGSLWTIRYELACYVFVALLGMVGFYRKRKWVVGLAVAVFLVHMFSSLQGIPLLHLGKLSTLFFLFDYFMAGMLMYLYRDRIPYSGWLFAFCVVVLIVSGMLNKLTWTMPFFGGYVLLYIAFSRHVPLQKFARHGDFSYGLYLYACPVQQLLVSYFPGQLSPHGLFFSAMLITLTCAALSWQLIEKPCLELKSRSLALRPKMVPAIPAEEGAPS